MSAEDIQREIAALQVKLRKARKTKRAAVVKPFTLERAQAMQARIAGLGRRESALWDTLRRRCPHVWKVTRRVDEGDCDGIGWARIHFRECKICRRNEDLPWGDK